MQHHAYYIEGSLSQFDTHKTALKPFWASAFERFGIDESRELIALSSLKNFKEAVFLIGAASITSEAQQALLKLFEERVRDFVNALEIELVKDIKKNRQGLEEIAMVRDYVGDRAPSLKMLLEHLALSLPTI